MILVDTSVWADHLRRGEPGLIDLLDRRMVLTHPFVIEELACGHLPDRSSFLRDIEDLPKASVASHAEVLTLISEHGLFGSGIGSVDAHLIASALLTRALIWTKDKRLIRESARLGVAYAVRTGRQSSSSRSSSSRSAPRSACDALFRRRISSR